MLHVLTPLKIHYAIEQLLNRQNSKSRVRICVPRSNADGVGHPIKLFKTCDFPIEVVYSTLRLPPLSPDRLGAISFRPTRWSPDMKSTLLSVQRHPIDPHVKCDFIKRATLFENSTFLWLRLCFHRICLLSKVRLSLIKRCFEKIALR